MSESKPRVSIVGLGIIGSSIGMALRKAGVTSVVTGHDSKREVSAEAKRLGAVDRTDWNLISTCEDADLVILSAPIRGIEESLKVLGPNLRPGCVVMDTASVKEPVMAWAAASLPEQVHFVGGNPILSRALRGLWGVEHARADLLDGALFSLGCNVSHNHSILANHFSEPECTLLGITMSCLEIDSVQAESRFISH